MDWYRAEIRNEWGTAIKATINGSDLERLIADIQRHGLENGDQIIIRVEK